MAKAKITGKIPGVNGEIEVTGNLATEDAMQELIAAVQGQAKSQKIKTDDLQDNLDDASGGLDEFSDELDSAVRSQSKLNKQVIELTKNTARSTASFVRTTSRTDSMSDMVESAGDIISGLAGGLAGLVPFIGEGTARLAEAATQAGFMLLSMAVGAIEGFQALNRSIMDSGTLLDGGFSGFAAAADEAGLPIQAFGEAVLANTNRLRLMAGGAPGGLARLSAGFRELREATDENMAQLYALGFTNTEVAAGMANVAIAAERAGRNLSSEELAAETYDYMRNLRELNRLTGISAEEAMAQVEANRANLFVQNQLAGLGADQRDAANLFIASMERAGLGPLTDFAMTGQYLNEQTAMMATRMGPLSDIMRQYFLDLESGADPEAAMARFNQSVATNSDAIDAAIQENARTFGLTRELGDQFAYLGEGGLSIQRMIEAAAQGTDPLSGLGGTSENLSLTMGELQQAVSDSQAAIQSTFVQGLSALSGEAGALTSFAQAISGAALGVENFKDAMLAVMRGDYEAAADIFGVEKNKGDAAARAAKEAAIQSGAAAATPQDIAAAVALGTGPGSAVPDELDPFTEEVAGLISELNYVRGELEAARLQEVQHLITDWGNKQQGIIDRLQSLGVTQGYNKGGIANYPDTGGLATLHGTEAVVPLPDGKTIPVTLTADQINAVVSPMARNQTEPVILNIDGIKNSIIDALSSATTSPTIDTEKTSNVQTFAESLDNSRSLPELVNISRNMLGQMTASTQKLEQMIRAMEQNNTISRNAAYARA